MRYLGGKHKQARAIVAAMGVGRGARWWDATCGGLSVSVALARACGPGVVSDACAPLVSLYQAVRDGWDPPRVGTREDWESARDLPDSDPRKAFFGFGASHGAKWYAGWSGEARRRWNEKENRWCNDEPIAAARRALLRDVPLLAGCELLRADFLAHAPGDVDVVFADPPYEGTTRYGAVPALDRVAFWRRCQTLAQRSRVYVTEYACPVPHELVWSRERGSLLVNEGTGLDPRARRGRGTRTEHLFRVLPT